MLKKKTISSKPAKKTKPSIIDGRFSALESKVAKLVLLARDTEPLIREMRDTVNKLVVNNKTLFEDNRKIASTIKRLLDFEESASASLSEMTDSEVLSSIARLEREVMAIHKALNMPVDELIDALRSIEKHPTAIGDGPYVWWKDIEAIIPKYELRK